MSFDEEFVEKFQKCLSICKKILILKGCTELDCINKLESYLKVHKKSRLDKLQQTKVSEDRSDESLKEIKKRFKKLTSEFNKNYTNFNKDQQNYKQKRRTKEKKFSEGKTWNIKVNVKVTKRETLMQAQAELKEKRKQNRENNDQRSEEGNAGTITPKEENISSKTGEKTNDESEIKKVAISHDSLKSKQPSRSNQKIEPVKSKDSSRSQNPTNDLAKDSESQSRSQNPTNDLAKGSESQTRSQNQNAESIKTNESRSGQKVEPSNSKDSDSFLGMGLEALCLGHTSSEKSQNQSNISAKGSETRSNMKKSEPRENLKKSESVRSKDSSRDKQKQQVSSKSRDQSRQKRMQKNKDLTNKGDKMKIQSEVGADAKFNKGNEPDKEKEVKQEASQANDAETDEKAPQDLPPPINKKKDDAESEAAFSPQLYSFTQMSKTSGVRLAMSPPFWLLMDHLLAVTWKLYSKKESEKKGLGIAQLQWAYEFLAVMKDKNNELKQPMNSLSALMEDALINAYSKLGDINKISEQTESQGFKNNKATRKDDTEPEEKMSVGVLSVETDSKHWEPQEKQVSYTLNDILIRAPTLQKDFSKENKTKEDKQITKPEQKKTLEKDEVLKYLEHIKKEQRDRAYREKIHLEEIEEVIKLVQKDKFENETWRKSALKKEDKSKKRMHEDLLANEKSEVHFSA